MSLYRETYMKNVNLIHNPGAGDGDHEKKSLLELLKKEGYECRYFSTKKKGWEKFKSHADLLVVAGGDGTVRKVAGEILKRKLYNRPYSIGVLPLGTANNIATTLGMGGKVEKVIRSWETNTLADFDIGRLRKVPEHKFFLESFGYGLFPALIEKMKDVEDDDNQSPEERLGMALEKLQRIIHTMAAKQCSITIDDKDYSGKFLMVEVMNTPSIGPNLCISPRSHPGDGQFEVVIVKDSDRKKLAAYVAGLKKAKSCIFDLTVIKGRNIKIVSELAPVHCDDELVNLPSDSEVSIILKKSALHFLGSAKD